ncbi:MAG: histidine kinase [Gloeobacteraceae cyanobacterium ES-bin-316]|nr:histidine kinase [Ferruginibacter sp.]
MQIEWYYALGTITAITLAIWEASRFLQPWFAQRIKRSPNKITWLVLFFAAGSVATTFLAAGIVFLVSMVLHQHNITETLVPLKLNIIYAWLANLLFHLLNAIMFYFREYKNKWVEAEELKRITAQAELQLVKSQVNPHFLFNNLNVLSALVLQNNNEANKFIEAFSKVYRYILSTHDKELVDIKTELDYIKPYIFLLEKRFSEGLSINIDIPEEYESKYIIPASLQMLIENAIKHNIVSRQRPLNIDVHINGNNTIVVSNNLQTRNSVENSTEIGLTNIKKRYQLVSGREVLIAKTQSDFTVTLPLLTLN